MPRVQCRATSKTTGEQCGKLAIMGGTVCRVHGGAAPQVRDAARRRLLDLVAPAIVALAEIVESSDERARLAAARDILDRCGLREAEVVHVITFDAVEAEIARLEAELAADGVDAG